eukprot:4863238-Prymnesium_polylepis.1
MSYPRWSLPATGKPKAEGPVFWRTFGKRRPRRSHSSTPPRLAGREAVVQPAMVTGVILEVAAVGSAKAAVKAALHSALLFPVAILRARSLRLAAQREVTPTLHGAHRAQRHQICCAPKASSEVASDSAHLGRGR